MNNEKILTRLANFKETVNYYYQENANILEPVLKFLLSLGTLFILYRMFPYRDFTTVLWYCLMASVIQAMVPLSVMNLTGNMLVILNLSAISLDIVAGYAVLMLICWLMCIRFNKRLAFMPVLVAVLFYLKLEYFLPVLIGMFMGFSGLLPVAFGTIIYFFAIYTSDASALLTTSDNQAPGLGLQRIVSLLVIDKKLLVILVSFSLVIFAAAKLNQLFHERAWLFSVLISYLALALLLLSGRFIFELDYSIWRIFLECVLGIILCIIIWFFRGIGDVSRMERVTFEDEDYIYFVKAVPKIKVTKRQREVTKIEAEEDTDSFLEE